MTIDSVASRLIVQMMPLLWRKFQVRQSEMFRPMTPPYGARRKRGHSNARRADIGKVRTTRPSAW